jgi:hypothetical protein
MDNKLKHLKMRPQILELIEQQMLNRTIYFTREQEIQIFLSHIFESSGLFDSVHVEQHIPSGMIPNYPWTDTYNIYIDIVLHKDGRYYPIEIKFKTKCQEVPIQLFGLHQMIQLGHHGAQNIGCYDFWKDVKRLELYESSFQNVEQGIMLFVTNDETYLQAPLNMNAGYAQYSIHAEKTVTQHETLDWNRALSISRNRPPIQLNKSYHLEWTQMQLQNHFFLLL